LNAIAARERDALTGQGVLMRIVVEQKAQPEGLLFLKSWNVGAMSGNT
jgi:hypothetical protein